MRTGEASEFECQRRVVKQFDQFETLDDAVWPPDLAAAHSHSIK
jgi:hypothetical protein